MNFILSAVTILTLSICGPGKYTITEELNVIKPTKPTSTLPTKYKKVPTKWVKITEKSN